MSAVEVTISGVLYDKVNRTMQNVVLIGEASLTGLGPGGGPILPGNPPGIWGPNDPRPTPPIHLPGTPPGIWGPNDPRPTPPIFIPPDTPPVIPPGTNEGTGIKEPPADGGWGFVTGWGWGYFPGTTNAGPKK